MRSERSPRSRLNGGNGRIWGKRIPLLDAIERRLALPGDSSTRRFQKMLVVVVSLFGSVTTMINALPFFEGFLDAMAWTYVASAVILFLGAVAILVRPSLYGPVTFLILLEVLVVATTTQVLSGGYTSGILAMPWTMLAPLGAVLTLGARPALVQLALFVVAVVVAARLEPFSRSIGPFIAPGVMLQYNVSSLLSLGLIAAAPSLYLLRQVERFRHQADSLLLNVLPVSVADRLKKGEAPIADGYDSVTILFADVAGFTAIASEAAPSEVVGMLNEVFSDFDDLAKRHAVEKVKTIGDAYMAASGLTESDDDPAAMIEFAIDLLRAVERKTWPGGEPVRLRVGIHVGPVVAGVIGHERFIYDVWGDVVNIASRMESTGAIGAIQVSQEVKDRLEHLYRFEERHAFPVKGLGMCTTYLLVSERIPQHAPHSPVEPEIALALPEPVPVLPAG